MVETALITYETIYDLLRSEKNHEGLQPLPHSFFDDVGAYLAEKERILREGELKQDVFSKQESQKTKVQVQNILHLLTDLYTRREKKIVELALAFVRTKSKVIDTSALHAREQELFESVMSMLERSRAAVLADLLTPKIAHTTTRTPDVVSQKVKSTTLQAQLEFVSDVDLFIDANLKEYGPFTPGQLAAIPTEIADILVAEGKARVV